MEYSIWYADNDGADREIRTDNLWRANEKAWRISKQYGRAEITNEYEDTVAIYEQGSLIRA